MPLWTGQPLAYLLPKSGAAAAKAARSVLRHIRVSSKHGLKQRIMEFIHDLNRDTVIHR
jgi:hypothetical protein